jgi:DNA-binding MarR family transcriptional regulator
MIEIKRGTLEEQIIKILQKTYPITVKEITDRLHLSEKNVIRTLQKLQTKGIVQLEPLSDKIFIRLLRNDFKVIGKKRQRKFIKHHKNKKKTETKEYDGMMYS